MTPFQTRFMLFIQVSFLLLVLIFPPRGPGLFDKLGEFPQAAVQQNTTYSCTVDFVPADQHTDQMAAWTATARASVVLSASHRMSGSVIQTNRDKRVADAACLDFFAERAKHQSPADDTALGK